MTIEIHDFHVSVDELRAGAADRFAAAPEPPSDLPAALACSDPAYMVRRKLQALNDALERHTSPVVRETDFEGYDDGEPVPAFLAPSVPVEGPSWWDRYQSAAVYSLVGGAIFLFGAVGYVTQSGAGW